MSNSLIVDLSVCALSLRPDDQESFLSLSSKMSEHQKQLADLPETIKVQLLTQHMQYEIIGECVRFPDVLFKHNKVSITNFMSIYPILVMSLKTQNVNLLAMLEEMLVGFFLWG